MLYIELGNGKRNDSKFIDDSIFDAAIVFFLDSFVWKFILIMGQNTYFSVTIFLWNQGRIHFSGEMIQTQWDKWYKRFLARIKT